MCLGIAKDWMKFSCFTRRTTSKHYNAKRKTKRQEVYTREPDKKARFQMEYVGFFLISEPNIQHNDSKRDSAEFKEAIGEKLDSTSTLRQ